MLAQLIKLYNFISNKISMRIPLILFLVSFSLLGSAQKSVSIRLVDNNMVEYVTAAFGEMRGKVRTLILSNKIKVYTDESLVKSYSSLDLIKSGGACEKVTVVTDPSNPYKTRDTIVCTPHPHNGWILYSK